MVSGQSLAALRASLARREGTVGVIGLGYVGLPLAATMVESGLAVAGFDTDVVKVEKLRRKESYIRHIDVERISGMLSEAKDVLGLRETKKPGFVPTSDFSELSHCDAIVICVPTPLTEGREPDLGAVRQTAETVAKYLRRGQLVVLESTTYPGTTDEVVGPILESGSGLKVGEDFALAFSPEREDPGNGKFSTRTIPKVVGGVTPECGEIAAALYRGFIERVVPVTTARVAESTKLLENIFRAVNIALVNELKMLFDRMEIDVWEVIEAAGTKPFGYMPFYPGPGLGGHCIPIDPFYLTWKARHFDFSTRFIELAGEINTSMPYYVIERVVEALGERGKAVRGAKVLVLGVAYKKDIDDLRESPSLRLIEILESKGAEVSYNDPYVHSLRARRFRHYDTFELDSVELTPERIAQADCVLIATDHSDYDYAAIADSASLIVDTRNATRNIHDKLENIIRA